MKTPNNNKQQQQRGRFNIKDPHFHEAKKQGFVARSIFKLEEIDKSLRLIKANDAVLDLGCCPGSWLQYVEQKINKGAGCAIGIDLQKVDHQFGSKVRVIQGDIYEQSPEKLAAHLTELGSTKIQFDVLLSDMAPNTSGIKSMDQYKSYELCCRALELTDQLLVKGGHFCVKIFEGPDINDFVAQCKKIFTTVQIKRPKAIRVTSKEVYVVGLTKKA